MQQQQINPPVPPIVSISFWQAFLFWLKLGFISFGGPAGQIAMLHQEMVEKRRWISERRFLHALNYCMLLPGPEAMQLVVYIGWLLHGVWGGLLAGLSFIVPGFLILGGRRVALQISSGRGRRHDGRSTPRAVAAGAAALDLDDDRDIGKLVVGRQRRLRIDDSWFRVDLLFFHRGLKCLLVIDLKVGKFSYADAGQMHMYLNYARQHWMKPGENPPIGLILCSSQGSNEAHYTLEGLSNKVLTAEYRTALPDEKRLAEELDRTRRELEARRIARGGDAEGGV